MIKLLTIIGARPQIIKAAALSRGIKKGFSDKIQEKILHTGQHYDDNMSEVFFREMGIPAPDFNLHVGSNTHGQQTANMIAGIEEVLLSEKFDALVVFGDTNSTLAGAIAAAKIHVPIIHIEAGLRSYNMAMPEEQNRILCDQLSTLLFSPTETGINNLKKEGFFTSRAFFANGKTRKVFNSGDIMYDNSMYFAKLADEKTDIISRLRLSPDGYILATIHRDTNTDNPERLNAIFEALLQITEEEQISVIIPLHPRTKKMLPINLKPGTWNILNKHKLINIIEPASFFEMIALEKNAKLVMTDSGGVQKEAYYFKKPCIILRSETEWVEIVEQGAGMLADANTANIINAYQSLIQVTPSFPTIFGDAHAAEKILQVIVDELSPLSNN